MAELNSCNRDWMAHKASNIYLALYKKCLPSPGRRGQATCQGNQTTAFRTLPRVILALTLQMGGTSPLTEELTEAQGGGGAAEAVEP